MPRFADLYSRLKTERILDFAHNLVGCDQKLELRKPKNGTASTKQLKTNNATPERHKIRQ